jgi:hypothetical protein
MTHEERALAIVDRWDEEEAEGRLELIQRISRGMAEASNAELERRRVVEVERDWLREKMRAEMRMGGDPAWLREFLIHKMRWSAATFGPGARTQSIIAHTRKELLEIEADKSDIREWLDVVLLAIDGYWRQWMADTDLDIPEERLHFLAACDFIQMLLEKQQINEARTWPAPGPQDQPMEHIK